MMNFHHGGRIGDLIYALYTVKQLGGGNVYLSLSHGGSWNQRSLDAVIPLVEYQPYVNECKQIIPGNHDINIDIDFKKIEDFWVPEAFPEWNGPAFPGNINLAKRYFVLARPTNEWLKASTSFNPHITWLEAPTTKANEVDVVFHMPMRRLVRNPRKFAQVLMSLSVMGAKVVILGGEDDIHEWKPFVNECKFVVPDNFLDVADYINSAKVFIGGASSCNTIAEGLKKIRLVELAPDCHNTFPYGVTGFMINDWPVEAIIDFTTKMLTRYGVPLIPLEEGLANLKAKHAN